MVDVLPSFEGRDTQGTTSHFNGTVGTSAAAVPAVAGLPISEFSVRASSIDSETKTLLISLDGGTTFKTIQPGEEWHWSPKGQITQIYLKGGVASTDYEMVMNREPV